LNRTEAREFFLDAVGPRGQPRSGPRVCGFSTGSRLYHRHLRTRRLASAWTECERARALRHMSLIGFHAACCRTNPQFEQSDVRTSSCWSLPARTAVTTSSKRSPGLRSFGSARSNALWPHIGHRGRGRLKLSASSRCISPSVSVFGVSSFIRALPDDLLLAARGPQSISRPDPRPAEICARPPLGFRHARSGQV